MKTAVIVTGGRIEKEFVSSFLKKTPYDYLIGVDHGIEFLRQENLPYKPDQKLKTLTVSDIQMLEIIKAISNNAQIVIMDEPTSAITNREVEVLFGKIAELKKKGVSIIYISHKMEEVFRIADDITVLRDGKTVETHPASEIDLDKVIALMVGNRRTWK